MFVRLNFHRQRKTRTFHTFPVAQEYADKAWVAFYALEHRLKSPEALVRHMVENIPESARHRLASRDHLASRGEGAFFMLVDLYALECTRRRFLGGATARRDKRRLVARTQREAFFATLGRKCTLCGATQDLTFDHIHPWSLRGKTELGNLRVLCRACNTRKSNRMAHKAENPGTVRAQCP